MNSKLRGAAIIGQSGGPTVVINQSLIGFIEEARKSEDITRVLGARHGVEGMMQGDWIDLGNQSSDLLEAVARTPAAALGSVRRKASVEDVALMIFGCGPERIDHAHPIDDGTGATHSVAGLLH